MSKYLPVFLNIENKNILIVGGGKAALQKILILKKFTDSIIVVAPFILPEITELGLTCYKRKFKNTDLKNKEVVYICTDDKKLQIKIRMLALKKRILANTVDDKLNSDFISPAVFLKDNMTIAVSSNGENVKDSIKWRDKIKEIIENDKFN